jgi:hypothetical protein
VYHQVIQTTADGTRRILIQKSGQFIFGDSLDSGNEGVTPAPASVASAAPAFSLNFVILAFVAVIVGFTLLFAAKDAGRRRRST